MATCPFCKCCNNHNHMENYRGNRSILRIIPWWRLIESIDPIYFFPSFTVVHSPSHIIRYCINRQVSHIFYFLFLRDWSSTLDLPHIQLHSRTLFLPLNVALSDFTENSTRRPQSSFNVVHMATFQCLLKSM